MAEALKVQLGIRQNAEELQDFLKDLNSWEEAVKTKDEELRMSKIINKQVRFFMCFLSYILHRMRACFPFIFVK